MEQPFYKDGIQKYTFLKRMLGMRLEKLSKDEMPHSTRPSSKLRVYIHELS